ncbi:hypothetical protein KY329_05220 [Candidatus Woesearchaeota archaeon]|nr:hypothetical protein [Candidatus Woesearchaeota archaeon]
MENKAQIIGQVFIFILAGLVFILIVAYGYKAIQGFGEKSEQVSLIDFKNDLDRSVESVKRDYGSVRQVSLRLPSKYAGVCFLDSEQCPAQVWFDGSRIDWAVSACASRAANVFLVPRALDLSFEDIEVESPFYVCIPNKGGEVVFRLEGTGKKARVAVWK